MVYRLEKRSAFFEKLCVAVPELRNLEKDVIRCTDFLMKEDPRPTNQSDTNLIWHILFKPRVERLVGFMAEDSPDIASTSEAYDAVIRYLHSALAPSEVTLENSGVDEYGKRCNRALNNWDGSEETKPEFISAEEVMRSMVVRLGLPTTEIYLRRVRD
jgi:hypothetical protein